MKISDQAGNETFRTAVVNVNPLSFLQIPSTLLRASIPEFAPPTTNEAFTTQQDNQPTSELTFGNENNGNTANETTSSNAGGENVFQNATAQASLGSSNSFIFGNESTTTPITNTNILWGAVAAAAVGMTLAEWQKKREEEEKQRQSERTNIAGRKKYEEKMRMKRIVGESQALLNQKYADQKKQREADRIRLIAKNEERAPVDMAKVNTLVQQANTHNHLMNEHRDSRVNVGGGKPFASLVQQDDPPWWETAWNNATTWWEEVSNNAITWTTHKVEQIFPALRSTGPGENGINLVDKYRDVIVGTVSSFNNFIRTYGSIPYIYEYTNGKGKTIQEQQDHSVPINPTSLAISMSVQAEAPGFVDFFQWVFAPINSPSYGMAQIDPDKYELIKQNIQPYVNIDRISNNPYFALRNSQVSTAAMIERIAPSLEICEKHDCTPTDREIVIALSQNGPGFDAVRLEGILNDIKYVSDNQETIIDWQKYFNDQKPYPRGEGIDGAYRYYILNWRASGHNFDTWFMLNRYYNNAMVFEDAGNWSMPEGVNWDYIESLIENTPPTQP